MHLSLSKHVAMRDVAAEVLAKEESEGGLETWFVRWWRIGEVKRREPIAYQEIKANPKEWESMEMEVNSQMWGGESGR